MQAEYIQISKFSLPSLEM